MNNDLISRSALKKALEVTQYNDIDDLTRTERLIDNAPTVEIPTELCKGCRFLKDCETCEEKLRPQGEWITRETPEGTTYLIECPVCGYQKGNKWVIFTVLPPYCECCGAKLGTNNETHD